MVIFVMFITDNHGNSIICLKYSRIQFLYPPGETKIGSRKREVQEIEGKITEKYYQGEQKLILEIGSSEKLRDSTVPLI